jgi:hypothetical protein
MVQRILLSVFIFTFAHKISSRWMSLHIFNKTLKFPKYRCYPVTFEQIQENLLSFSECFEQEMGRNISNMLNIL